MSDTNTSGSAPVKKNITRRDVLAMAGCGVAGLVVGGA
ncbi:twin-arginine translocation signal domain-containing protein, partial [Senegalimassilia anaerobia]